MLSHDLSTVTIKVFQESEGGDRNAMPTKYPAYSALKLVLRKSWFKLQGLSLSVD